MENFKWCNHRNTQKFQANNTSCWFQMLPLLYENEFFRFQQLEARSSSSPLTGVCHLHQTDTCCGKVGQIPHYCKNKGHKVVGFVGERFMRRQEQRKNQLSRFWGSKSTVSEALSTSQTSAFPSCREEPQSRAEPSSRLPPTRAPTDCEYSDSHIRVVKLLF